MNASAKDEPLLPVGQPQCTRQKALAVAYTSSERWLASLLKDIGERSGMSGQKRCFLTATELAYGVRAKELLAVEVMEARLAQIARINPQVDAAVTLPPEEERGATLTSSARSQVRRTWEGLP